LTSSKAPKQNANLKTPANTAHSISDIKQHHYISAMYG